MIEPKFCPKCGKGAYVDWEGTHDLMTGEKKLNGIGYLRCRGWFCNSVSYTLNGGKTWARCSLV